MDPCVPATNHKTGKGKEWNVLNLNNTSASSMRELSSLDAQCIKKYIQFQWGFNRDGVKVMSKLSSEKEEEMKKKKWKEGRRKEGREGRRKVEREKE